MSEVVKPLPGEFTKDQEKILSEVYLYTEGAEITPAELEMAREMFDRPEKFLLLRKVLGVFTPQERGLAFPNPQSLIQADTADLQKYAFETALNNLADEKVRQALVGFYRMIRGSIVDIKKAEFDAANAEVNEEEKRSEEYQEQKEVEERIVGPNL